MNQNHFKVKAMIKIKITAQAGPTFTQAETQGALLVATFVGRQRREDVAHSIMFGV